MEGSMMRKLSTWLVVGLAGGALVAGCGSSGTSTSSSQTTSTAVATTPTAAKTTPTAAKTTPTTAKTTPSGATTGKGATDKASAKRAVAACKRGIEAQPTVSAGEKTKLEAICEKAASGDATARRKAVEEVCVGFVDASVPPGAYRERALAICKVK
jgi:hypothetical protein